jgi:NAD(P)-dependent dehydrogenase (short-subunit alcohol dehydrogenase family)
MAMTETTRGVALITGAARRIGRALALEAAACGYDIAIHHRDAPEDAESLASEVANLGCNSITLNGDLSDRADVAGLVAAAGRLGPVTLLVNSASLFEDDRLETLTAQSWGHHMRVNLETPVMLTQAFAAALPADAKGLVVNIVDQRATHPNPLFFSYTLSKTALLTATTMAAQALAPRIRVNAIGPGPTLPSIHQDKAAFAAEAAATPLGQPVKPSEIAAALRYLIDAGSVTGQMISVDAGQHLAWRTPDIQEP